MMLRIFALGGNQVSPSGRFDPETGKFHSPTIGEQWKRAAETCEVLADFLCRHPEDLCVLVHGNGPQVGNILLRAEYSSPILPPLPLDVCSADSQGAMGYMLTLLSNSLAVRGVPRLAAETVTRVLVDEDDPSFQDPRKFIGPALTAEEAREREAKGLTCRFYKKDDDGREIWRRVVPSPAPVDVIELDIVEAVLRAGHIPIAVGGGGIPVVKVPPLVEGDEEVYTCQHDITYRRARSQDRKPAEVLAGREAVIDKDLSAALLGIRLRERARSREEELQVELVIITDVDCVKLDFQGPEERDLPRLTVTEARRLLAGGAFPAGSMGPKVEAAVRLVEGGGKRAMITRIELLEETLRGEAGTTLEG